MKIKMTQGVKERGKSVALNSVDSRSGAKPEKWPLAWAVIVVFFFSGSFSLKLSSAYIPHPVLSIFSLHLLIGTLFSIYSHSWHSDWALPVLLS